jgi:flagellar assembly factor FliW
MLLNNYGAGSRQSPATDRFTSERKESFFCDFAEREFFFPAGILGFANWRHYKLERFCPTDGSESPFLILRSIEPSLEFPLIHPSSLSLDYRFDAGPEVLAALEADSTFPLVPLLIVTVRDRLEKITVNLQGPLLLNPLSAKGLQLVVEEYPLRHPLLATTAL